MGPSKLLLGWMNLINYRPEVIVSRSYHNILSDGQGYARWAEALSTFACAYPDSAGFGEQRYAQAAAVNPARGLMNLKYFRVNRTNVSTREYCDRRNQHCAC